MCLSKFILACFALVSCQPAFADTQTPGQKITDFALNKLNSVFDVVSKTIPTVTKYVLEVTSIECLFNLLFCLIPLIIAIAVYNFAFKPLRKLHEEQPQYDWDVGSWFVMAGVVALLSIFLIEVYANLWSFVCVLHPDLYLIHLAVQKVLG